MKEVITAAEKAGICPEWLKEMKKNPTIEAFADMYFKGSDWSGEHDFPSLEMAKKYKAKLKEQGIFVDEKKVDLHNPKRAAFLGKSKGKISFDNFTVAPDIIVRHDSEITISARNNAIVSVNLLDNAKVIADAQDNAKILINNYGENTQYTISGRATERKAEWT